MELVKTEVAALEVQERIKKVDASFTWPHPTDRGYFVNATFVRTDDNTPYLIYCPKNTASISIDEETFNPYFLITDGKEWPATKKITLTQQMQTNDLVDVLFYIFKLKHEKPKEIKKGDIEKLFGVKVVD